MPSFSTSSFMSSGPSPLSSWITAAAATLACWLAMWPLLGMRGAPKTASPSTWTPGTAVDSMLSQFTPMQQWVCAAAVQQALIHDPGKGLDARAAQIFLKHGSLMHWRSFWQSHQQDAREVGITKTLEQQPFLTGDTFTIADAYLWVVLNWADFHKLDLSPWPSIQAFRARVAQRPAVQATLKAEGLAK